MRYFEEQLDSWVDYILANLYRKVEKIFSQEINGEDINETTLYSGSSNDFVPPVEYEEDDYDEDFRTQQDSLNDNDRFRIHSNFNSQNDDSLANLNGGGSDEFRFLSNLGSDNNDGNFRFGQNSLHNGGGFRQHSNFNNQNNRDASVNLNDGGSDDFRFNSKLRTDGNGNNGNFRFQRYTLRDNVQNAASSVNSNDNESDDFRLRSKLISDGINND